MLRQGFASAVSVGGFLGAYNGGVCSLESLRGKRKRELAGVCEQRLSDGASACKSECVPGRSVCVFVCKRMWRFGVSVCVRVSVCYTSHYQQR